jgi:hypothetical protein
MPLRKQMSELVTVCKQRCDLENDEHISDTEWKRLISRAYGEIWMVVSGTGLRYFEATNTITADGSASYSEPEGHLSTVQVVRVEDDGRQTPLDELMSHEETHMKGSTGDARYWTLVDDQLFLYPTPTSGTYKWHYQQQPTDLSSYADDDVVDLVTMHGYNLLIELVAVQALAKGEKSVQLAIAERDRLRSELEFWAASRHIADVRRRVTPDDVVIYGHHDWRWR